MKEIMSRARTQLTLICVMTLFASGCVTRAASRSDSRPAQKPPTAISLSDYIRGVYKVSSEASRHAEQREALLSSAPELAPLLDRAENDPMDAEARSSAVAEYMSR